MSNEIKTFKEMIEIVKKAKNDGYKSDDICLWIMSYNDNDKYFYFTDKLIAELNKLANDRKTKKLSIPCDARNGRDID